MYVPPTFNRIGDARDVVLGSLDFGHDLDTTAIIPDLENGSEYPFPIQK